MAAGVATVGVEDVVGAVASRASSVASQGIGPQTARRPPAGTLPVGIVEVAAAAVGAPEVMETRTLDGALVAARPAGIQAMPAAAIPAAVVVAVAALEEAVAVDVGDMGTGAGEIEMK